MNLPKLGPNAPARFDPDFIANYQMALPSSPGVLEHVRVIVKPVIVISCAKVRLKFLRLAVEGYKAFAYHGLRDERLHTTGRPERARYKCTRRVLQVVGI